MWQNCKKVLLPTVQNYVLTIANNLLNNEFKHRKVKLKFRAGTSLQQGSERPDFLLEEEEFRGRLEAAISALPEKQRVVFLLSRLDKKSYREIGEMLGISRQAVEKRMYNKMNKKRKVSKMIK